MLCVVCFTENRETAESEADLPSVRAHRELEHWANDRSIHLPPLHFHQQQPHFLRALTFSHFSSRVEKKAEKDCLCVLKGKCEEKLIRCVCLQIQVEQYNTSCVCRGTGKDTCVCVCVCVCVCQPLYWMLMNDSSWKWIHTPHHSSVDATKSLTCFSIVWSLGKLHEDWRCWLLMLQSASCISSALLRREVHSGMKVKGATLSVWEQGKEGRAAFDHSKSLIEAVFSVETQRGSFWIYVVGRQVNKFMLRLYQTTKLLKVVFQPSSTEKRWLCKKLIATCVHIYC